MLEELKEQVCAANLKLPAEGLAFQTWGNVSGVDRDSGMVVIKPFGAAYEDMKPQHMVVVSLAGGHVVEGELRPSSDTPTHLQLYRAFEHIGGLAHTHSLYATAWAQAGREIPPFGTTHADSCRGAVPCTRNLTAEEIQGDYEAETGRVIVERMRHCDVLDFPGVLVCRHGPFAWGPSPLAAVQSAAVLERLAQLASETIRIEPYPKPISQELLDRHFLRKHGPNAYYGQRG